MHQGVRLKKVTTKRTKTSPSVAASTLAQAFKITVQTLSSIPIQFLHLLHLYSQIFIAVPAYQYIGKDQKYDCRCPPVQSGKKERLQEHEITSKAPEDSNTFSSPSVSNPSGIFSFLSRSPNATSTISSSAARSTPSGRTPTRRAQLEVPQPEDTSADVHEQTADPASSIIASVVSSIQTSTAPPQGNTPCMKSLSMNLLSLSYNYFYYSFS